MVRWAGGPLKDICGWPLVRGTAAFGRKRDLLPCGGLWFAAVQRKIGPPIRQRLIISRPFGPKLGIVDRVFIGVQMDQGAIEAVLDAALITDDEMSAGPEHWLTFQDPLPSWDHSQPA